MAVQTTPMMTARATGAAIAHQGRARRNAIADADPAARLGISTPSPRNHDDRAWVSLGSGDTTSATARWLPDRAATVPKAWVKKLAGAVPPASAIRSRRLPPEATSAPST